MSSRGDRLVGSVPEFVLESRWISRWYEADGVGYNRIP